MKTRLLSTVLFLLFAGMPLVAQQDAHLSTIDGKWEAKPNKQDKPIVVFDFKNDKGTVTGSITQNGRMTEIKSGTLEGSTLKFETTEIPMGGTESVTMAWKGLIDGPGEFIALTCTRVTGGDTAAQQLEARRIKPKR